MAKITDSNCNWSQIQSFNGRVCSYSSKTLFNEIRSVLPNALITTYSNKLLVGMTEMTDATGVTIKYSFDNAGRLTEVKNDDLNLLQKYEYRYQR